jgi:chemotaxis response regulator CheB
MGSLGHRRIVAVEPQILELEDKAKEQDCIGYELKETGPPAVAWLATERSTDGTMTFQSQAHLINNDPSRHFKGNWVIRRIAPDCMKLELAHLPMAKIDKILHKMGAETANIHIIGSSTAEGKESILRDLESRQSEWLENACRTMSNRLIKDWKDYK